MTGKAAALQGGLAALGLVVAYTTWQRGPEPGANEVFVIDATKNDIGRIRYEDDRLAVELEPRKGDRDAGIWLRLTEKTPKPDAAKNAKKEPGAKDEKDAAKSASTEKAAAPVTREVRGDEPATRLLDKFAPLRAPRALGVLDAAKLKELGLDAPKQKLDVTVKGETRSYVMAQAKGSVGEYYLRDQRDGRVFLLPRAIVGDLQAATSRLVDRRMHKFPMADVDRIVVAAGGKKRELVHLDRKTPPQAKLAPAATPDKPDAMAKNWHDRFWNTWPAEVLGRGETPKDGEPKTVVRVEYFDGKKQLGWTEVGKVEPPVPAESSGAESAPPPAPQIYARSEHTAGWVKLQPETTLISEAEKVAAGQ